MELNFINRLSYNLSGRMNGVKSVVFLILFLSVIGSPALAVEGADWVQETGAPGWTARTDISTGVTTFDGKLWVIGGRNSVGTVLNDVWFSTTGVTWTQALNTTPKFEGLAEHHVIAFNNRLWVIAGINDTAVANARVWSSPDGRAWTLENANLTGGTGISAGGITVHDSKIWIGEAPNVWSSSDGVTWELVTSTCGCSLAYDSLQSFQGKLWTVGGSNIDAMTKVYSSEDGVVWTLETADAGFSGVVSHGTEVFHNRLWKIAGLHNLGGDDGSVWASSDGVEWELINGSAGFGQRHEPGTGVLGTKMFLMGGESNVPATSAYADVWSTSESITENSITIISPTDNQVLETTSITAVVEVEAIEDTKFRVERDGNTIFSGTLDGSGAEGASQTFNIPFTSAPGIHTLKAILQENTFFFPDTLDEHQITYENFNGDPLFATDPTDNETVSSTDQPQFTVNIRTFESGTLRYDIWTNQIGNGTANQTITAPMFNTNGQATLISVEPNSPLPDGLYSWKATFQPSASPARSYATDVEPFVMDFANVEIDLVKPENNSVLTTQRPQFTIALESNQPGRIDVLVDNGVVASRSVSSGFPVTGTFFNLDSQVNISSGNHNWTSRYVANSGVTTPAPETWLFSIVPQGTQNATITLNSPADDAEFAIGDITFNYTLNTTVNGTLRLFVNQVEKSAISITAPFEDDVIHEETGLPPNLYGWFVSYESSEGTYVSETRTFEVTRELNLTLLEPEEDATIAEPPVVFKARIETLVEGTLHFVVDGAVRDSIDVDPGSFNVTSDGIRELTTGKHTWKVVFTQSGETVSQGTSSETREFTILRGDITAPGEAPSDSGIIPFIKSGIGGALGISGTAALVLFAIIASAGLGLIVALPFDKKGSIFAGVFGISLLGFTIAGFFPAWLLLVVIVIAGGIIAYIVKGSG